MIQLSLLRVSTYTSEAGVCQTILVLYLNNTS